MAVYKPQIKTENGMVDLDIQAERSLKDGNGDTISTTYVKSVNNVTPDANGNVNVSGGGGSTITLLWQNGSPTSAFNGQSITTLDMSPYKYLIISWVHYTNGWCKTYWKIFKDNTYFYIFSDNNSRVCQITSNTTITIGSIGSGGDNKNLVPTEIYGTNDD